MWTTWLCSTTTGDKLAQIDDSALVDVDWQRKLNGIGTGDLTLHMDGIGSGSHLSARRDDRRNLLTPWSRTVVRCWDDVPIYAGILTNPDVDGKKGTVSFRHAEFREMLKHRTTLGAGGYTPNRRQVFAGESLASLAGRLIRMAVEGPRPNYALPLVLPPVGMPGEASRTWSDFDLAYIEDELVEIQDDAGGPDVDFEPRWSADGGRLEWVPRIGTLGGPLLEWVLPAPESPVSGFSLQGNANQQANVIYATGDGSEEKLLVRSAWATTDVPAIERVESYSQLKNGRALQSHADAEVLSRQKPPSDWPFSMQADGDPGVLDLRLGQQHRVWSMDDPWIFDGWKDDVRLIGFSGNLTTTIGLQLQ